jgi:hypothetical protein
MGMGLAPKPFIAIQNKENTGVAPESSKSESSFPTVLVFGLDRTMVSAIRDGRYNVLEAYTQTDLMDVVLYHSRPIHLLLIDMSVDNRSLTARLKSYRPTMRMIFVGNDMTPDVVTPELVVGTVNQFFASMSQ